MDDVCLECGVPNVPGSCRACFEALLAFEAERPTVFGAVHHLTVATYYLQHPTGYGLEVLASWRSIAADALNGRATHRDLQQRMGRQFAGARRVRDARARVPPDWPTRWPMTVADVLSPLAPLPSPELYVERARAWAAATAAALDATQGSSDVPARGRNGS